MPELFIEITPGCLEAGDLPEGIQIRRGPIAEDAGHLKPLAEFVVTQTMNVATGALGNFLYTWIKKHSKKNKKHVDEMRINGMHTAFTKAAMKQRIEAIHKLK